MKNKIVSAVGTFIAVISSLHAAGVFCMLNIYEPKPPHLRE